MQKYRLRSAGGKAIVWEGRHVLPLFFTALLLMEIAVGDLLRRRWYARPAQVGNEYLRTLKPIYRHRHKVAFNEGHWGSKHAIRHTQDDLRRYCQAATRQMVLLLPSMMDEEDVFDSAKGLRFAFNRMKFCTRPEMCALYACIEHHTTNALWNVLPAESIQNAVDA